ncbi:MAG: hypothetical protein KF752_20540 [Pirellulaceae bacterium]|nr:hypothetical protein [Pirellulaceae bacterium]
MPESRREKILTMLEAEPQDVFLRYALAMELDKAGEFQQALDIHSQLAHEQPPHVPSYFRAAQMLIGHNEISHARAWLRDGIDIARQVGDLHAAAEMSDLLSQLGELGE